MSWLPDNFMIESYVDCCINLVREWRWLIKAKATDILKEGILDDHPASETLQQIAELNWEEMNQVPFGYLKDEWPDNLKNFVRTCSTLRPKIDSYAPGRREMIDKNLFKRMSPKKCKEVEQLSFLTAEICSKYNIKHVVDFGSGLGYVDGILHHHLGLTVLGLERDEKKVIKARQMFDGVEFRTSFVSKDTHLQVKAVIEEWLQGSPACFIALHGCGDLSVNIAELFNEVVGARALILVPCCYHLSQMRPLSAEVQVAGDLINTTLLRLASDGTAERWRLTTPQQHLAHARSVLSRALVQLFPSKDSQEIKRKHRHVLRSVSREDWEKCFESCTERISGVDSDRLKEAWDSNKWRLKQVEAYSCLLATLQVVAEGIVFADSYLFLTRHEDVNVKLVRLFDAVTSPRSVAYVVSR